MEHQERNPVYLTLLSNYIIFIVIVVSDWRHIRNQSALNSKASVSLTVTDFGLYDWFIFSFM